MTDFWQHIWFCGGQGKNEQVMGRDVPGGMVLRTTRKEEYLTKLGDKRMFGAEALVFIPGVTVEDFRSD